MRHDAREFRGIENCVAGSDGPHREMSTEPLDVDTLRRYSGPQPEGLGLVEWVITNGESHNCNCVEITEVSAKSFLGTPYVNVSAHSRHIQESSALSGYQH